MKKKSQSCSPPYAISPAIVNLVARISETVGRLWQTLILNRWNSLFADIPVESLVFAHQAEYYQALQEALNLQDRKSFRERYLKPALAEGLIEMTIPDKPRSRLQKYRLTGKGREVLKVLGKVHGTGKWFVD